MSEQKSIMVFVHGLMADSAGWDLLIDRCQAERHQFSAGLRPTFLTEHSL
jgi:hypothetical protein